MRKFPPRDPKFRHEELTVRGWFGKDISTKFGNSFILFRNKHLTRGTHFVKDWKKIYYSDEAVDILAKAIGLADKAFERLPDSPEPPKAEVVVQSMPLPVEQPVVKKELPSGKAVVLKANMPNARLLKAQKGDEVVLVWVKDAREWRPGMILDLTSTCNPGYYRTESKPRKR